MASPTCIVDVKFREEGLTSEQLVTAVEQLARAKVTRGQRARNRDIGAVLKLLGEEVERRQASALAWARAALEAEKPLAVEPAPSEPPAPSVETGRVRADQLQPGDRLLEVTADGLDLDAISVDLPLRVESANKPDRSKPIIAIFGEDRIITLPSSARCVVQHGAAR